MAAWSANTAVGAGRAQVMDILTRPGPIASWAPVPFEVEGLQGDRLQTGSYARVAGRLAGQALEFDVMVHKASCNELRLTAWGPFVELDVAYDIDELDDRAQLKASIDVKGKGVLGRFVAKAVDGLLAAGALNNALSQLAVAAETSETNLPPLALAAY